jgi:two-component system CheB/CheR fusion protein
MVIGENCAWREQDAQAFTRLMLAQTRQHGVLFFDVDRRVTGWNHGAWFITGWTAQEVVGQSTAMLFVPEDRERRLDEHEATVAAAVESAEDERWHLRKDGSRFWSSGITVPLKDEGRITGFVKIFRDATHLRTRMKYLENELDDSGRRHKHRDTFMGTIAHELRNPLNPMKMALELLRRSPQAASLAEVIRVMDRQLGFMERLVEDLVDLTRVQTGKMSITHQAVELQRLLAHALESCRERADAKGVALALILPPVPIPIEVDPQRIHQVVVNLLHNAIKFTPQGGGVWLSATVDQTHFIVNVKDNGVGISPELLPKIFDVFTQADGADTHRGSGLGIGLSVVKEIVALHQGTVEVRSEGPAKGSEFIVRVPLRRGLLPEPAAQRALPDDAGQVA